MITWTTLLQRAVERNILPASALNTPEPAADHPWPLVLLSFFGALLAALPFTALILFFLFNAHSTRDFFAPYVFGPVCIGVSCLILRGKNTALFVENLALVSLMVGMGLLFYGLIDDLHKAGSLLCAIISIGVALLISANWVRVLLGFLAAGFCYAALPMRQNLLWLNYAGVAQLLVWAAALWVQRNILLAGKHARLAIALEWLMAGWILQLLYVYATYSGMAFLVGGAFGGNGIGGLLAGEIYGAARHELGWLMQMHAILSVLLTLAGGLWGLKRCASLRTPAFVGLFVVLAALAWFMPALGYILLAGIVLLLTHRPIQAGAAALAAAWVISSFYYSLSLPLVIKAQILLVTGIVLGTLAWFSLRRANPVEHTLPAQSRPAMLLMLLAAVLTLGLVNTGIWQKENLIAHGRTVYIKLAPVDPRSLMQGDYMALNFDIPFEVRRDLHDESKLKRLLGVAKLNDNGIASIDRLAYEQAPGTGEILIELIPKNGRWVVVSDAWFFKEGDGERWSRARYGEFRVMPDGKALLVGMADEQLVPIKK